MPFETCATAESSHGDTILVGGFDDFDNVLGRVDEDYDTVRSAAVIRVFLGRESSDV